MGRNRTLIGPGPAWQEPSVGTTLDPKPYKVLEKIGEGGFGTVFLAIDTKTRDPSRKRIAIKHVHIQDMDGMRERFEREASVMDLVKHPGVVAYRDYFRSPAYGHFLVMEYVDGRNLDDLIERYGEANERLDLPFVLHVMEKLLETIGFVHGKGIVHRDLKAANVFIIARGDELPEVMIGDFGIAKVLADAKDDPALHKQLTDQLIDLRNFGIMGSPESMAPEQIQGAAMGKITPATDIYALGVLLYHMLTGELPFEPDETVGNEILYVLDKHLNSPPPDPRTLRKDAPEALADAVKKAMAKKREDRYQSAEEFLAVIRAVRAGLPPDSAPVSGMRKAHPEPERTEGHPLESLPIADSEPVAEPERTSTAESESVGSPEPPASVADPAVKPESVSIDALAKTLPNPGARLRLATDGVDDRTADASDAPAPFAPADAERAYRLRKMLAVLVACAAMLIIALIIWHSYFRR